MNFSTIALSKGYFYIQDSQTVSEEENMEFLKNLVEVTPEVLSVQAEVMRYGYMFDADCFRSMIAMSPEELKGYSRDISEYLAETYGDGAFISLFGDFPSKALSMSEMDFFFNQILHYMTNGAYAPHMYEVNEEDAELTRQHFEGLTRDSYKMIKLGTEQAMCDICKRMCSAQQSLTSYDKEVVTYFCKYYEFLGVNYTDILPEEIPFKETLCLVANIIPAYKLKTATDVLRLAVYMSGGDISLASTPKARTYGWSNVEPETKSDKFKKFTRQERRLILSKLEDVLFEANNAENVYADMKKYINKWIRLGEVIHPGEYKKQYPHSAEAFYMMRDCAKFVYTFASRVEKARSSKNFDELISLMMSRPGEFARNLDWILRKNEDKRSFILDAFKKSVDKISTKVLYEIIEYYANRNNPDLESERYVFIKSARKPIRLKDLPKISDTTVLTLLEILDAELNNRFATKTSLAGKKYFIDSNIKNILLPKNMRSMNVAPGQQARGTKIPLDIKTGMLRLYCRWMDPKGQYDLDLSCTGLTEDFKPVFTMSWNTLSHILKSKNTNKTVAVFSGDVRHRVGNSAEYIDVDIDGMKEMGVRYLVADVRDFDGGGFMAKDAWGGVMERETFGKGGETTWAPDTITNGFKITSCCTNLIMSFIDIEEMVMHVVDEDADGIPVASLYASRHCSLVKRYMNTKRYFNAYTLIEKNIVARGGEVAELEHDKFQEQVEMVADIKANIAQAIDEYTKLRSAFEKGSDGYKAINIILADILKKKEKVDSIEFVSYDDISIDYTTIFEWMF